MHPRRSREGFEGRLLGHRLTSRCKPEGTRACRKSRGHGKACTMWPCETRALWCKRNGLHPNLQRWDRTRTAPTPRRRCHHGRPVRLLRCVLFACWAMCSEPRQGDAWSTYVALMRSAPPERGMTYGARALGSRSPRSRRRWGEPTTWRRGTGRRHVKGKGCEMHNDLNLSVSGRAGRDPQEKTAGREARRGVHPSVSVRPTSPEPTGTQDVVAHHPGSAAVAHAARTHGPGLRLV